VTTTFRTEFTFRIDTWTPDGESAPAAPHVPFDATFK
jgi:hypothetical protein